VGVSSGRDVTGEVTLTSLPRQKCDSVCLVGAKTEKGWGGGVLGGSGARTLG